MSSRRTNDPSQESEDEGTTSSSSSSDNEDESEASIEEQIRVLTTQILQSNNGDLRAVNWDFVAQVARPILGIAVTGPKCEQRFSEIVDRIYPPNEPVLNAQATAGAGTSSSSTSTNAASGVANGSQATQLPVYGQLPIQSTSNGSSNTTSAADPRAAASSVPNPQTDTEEEDEPDADSEEST